MVFEIKKILFPTDLSDNSRLAFRHAASIANRYGADMVIFHVAEGLTETFKKRIVSFMGQAAWEQIKSAKEENAQGMLIGKRTERQVMHQALRKMTETLQADGELSHFDTDEIVIGEGNVTEAILKTALEKNCDMIVMTACGETLLSTPRLGATAKSVLKRSRIPVLIVPSPGA